MTPQGLVLASSSPRRRELLRHLQLPYESATSRVAESAMPNVSSQDLARTLARRKAEAVARDLPEATIIGADTIVTIDGEVLGKPLDAGQAKHMLRRLVGRRHEVVTAVAVCHAGQVKEAAGIATVQMRRVSDDELVDYVATGEPMDKAGAYAVQGLGSALVSRVEGCYLAVVGLPLCILGRLLTEVGMRPPVDGTTICLDVARSLRERARLLSSEPPSFASPTTWT